MVYNAALLLRYTTILLYYRAVAHLLLLVLGQDILHLVLVDESGRDLSRRLRGDGGELEGRWREMVGVDSVVRSAMRPLIRMEAARLLLYNLLYTTLLLDSTTRIYGCGVAGVGFWPGG